VQIVIPAKVLHRGQKKKKKIVKVGVLNKIMSAVHRGIVKQEFAMQLWSSIGHTGVVTFFFCWYKRHTSVFLIGKLHSIH
jgi:hypothetical protein